MANLPKGLEVRAISLAASTQHYGVARVEPFSKPPRAQAEWMSI